MPSQGDIQKQITERIIEGLKSGLVPWRKPWRADKNSGGPANVVSRRPYTGCNILLLDLVSIGRGYRSRFWATYDQWATLGAQVRKRPADVKPGHWATQIVFYKQIKRTKVENGEELTESFPLLRFYSVFNIDQVDGESVDHLRASTDSEAPPLQPDFDPARQAIEATEAEFRFGGDKAFYARPVGEWPNHRGGDFIQMPKQSQFIALHEFYATSFHELVHWCEVRLGWKGSYALGELVAEIGACFIAAQLGVPCSDDLSNHTSYLASWLKELENDPKGILKAASQAPKATEFILGFSRNAEPQADKLQTV